VKSGTLGEPLRRERAAPERLTTDYRERDGTRREKDTSGKDGYICSRLHTLLHREARNAHRTIAGSPLDPLEEPRAIIQDSFAARFQVFFSASQPRANNRFTNESYDRDRPLCKSRYRSHVSIAPKEICPREVGEP